MREARRKIIWAGALLIFVASFLYRFQNLSFHNDHFEHLALGAEIVDGATPGIDFFDPTRPLQYYLSAAGLWLFGHQLVAEALLSVTLLSVGATLVFLLGVEISGTVWLGVLASIFVIAVMPRLYAYPKILVPAAAVLACWRFIDRPSPWRLAAMCLATAMSFYFRFDYGVWLGVALTSALIVQYIRHARPLLTHVLAYIGGVALLCGPYVLFLFAMGGGISSGPGTGRLVRVLQGDDVVSFALPRVPAERPLIFLRPAGPLASVRWKPTVTDGHRADVERRYSLHMVRPVEGGGAWQYVLLDRSPETLTRLIADPAVSDVTNVDPSGQILRDPPWSVLRRWLHVPVMESILLTRENAAIWLYDALFLTPFAALVLLVARSATTRLAPQEGPKVTAVIALSLLFNFFLIRGNLDSRLPDVIVPAALLWAWMLRGWWLAVREAASAWRINRSAIRFAGRLVPFAASVLVMLSVWMAVDVYAGSVNQLIATDLLSTPRRAAARFKATLTDLRSDPLEQFAPPGSHGLRGLVRYVHRCTAPTDRLLVLGYQPEMFFYADRRIGGGNVVYQSNLGAAPAQQAIIVSRLQREHVPVVILPVDRVRELEEVYSIVKTYLDGRYHLAMESGFGEGRPFRVLVDNQAVASHVDEELGLPCFAGKR